MPPDVFSSSSMRLTMMRSCNGRNFMMLLLSGPCQVCFRAEFGD
jgi:hypothetical protein